MLLGETLKANKLYLNPNEQTSLELIVQDIRNEKLLKKSSIRKLEKFKFFHFRKI